MASTVQHIYGETPSKMSISKKDIAIRERGISLEEAKYSTLKAKETFNIIYAVGVMVIVSLVILGSATAILTLFTSFKWYHWLGIIAALIIVIKKFRK